MKASWIPLNQSLPLSQPTPPQPTGLLLQRKYEAGVLDTFATLQLYFKTVGQKSNNYIYYGFFSISAESNIY